MHRGVAAVALALVLFAVSVGLASSADSDAGSAATVVRLARFTASDSAVTAKFTGFAGSRKTMSVPPGTAPMADEYVQLHPGSYVIEIQSGTIRLVLTVPMRAGSAYTLGLFASMGTLRAVLLPDDFGAPPVGSARIRVVQAAAAVRHATVHLAHGPALTKDASFGAVTDYRTVRAGAWRITAVGAPRDESRAHATLRTVATVVIHPGQLITLVLGDVAAQGLAVHAFSDAAGAPHDPRGSVAAGGGGMAARQSVAAGVGWGVAAAVLLSATTIRAWRRPRLVKRQPRTGIRRRAWLRAVANLACLAILVAGLFAAAMVSGGYRAIRPSMGPSSRLPSSSAVPAVAVSRSIPIRLRIPAIGVSTALQPLGLVTGGTLQPPSRWQTAGWYRDGLTPGQAGPAVIAGHVDSTSGPAVFYRLHQLRPGDVAIVQRHDGRMLHFAVDSVAEYRKSAFPTAYVYGPTPLPTLRLVTCTGNFDWKTHSYQDNLVVSAHLVRVVI